MNLVFLKQIVNLVLLSILMIVCNSCSYDRGNKPRVFHYNQPNPVTSIDPAFAKTQNNIWIVDHLYNQLVDLNDSMQVVPELATNWNILDSGRVYEFKIRVKAKLLSNSIMTNHSTILLIELKNNVCKNY